MPLKKTLKGIRYDKLDLPGRFCHKMKLAAKQNNAARYIMQGENQIKILIRFWETPQAFPLF